MTRLPVVLIAIPLVIRHGHHFWCTRHASRHGHWRGLPSVVIWFVVYVLLASGSFYRTYGNEAHWNFWAGLVILWIATAGRIISIRELGRGFSEFIAMAPQKRLIDTGIYAYVRHPLHYFLVLEMAALSLIVYQPWGWCLVGLAMLTLVQRELQEEQFLEATFGEAYRAYRRRAAALVDLFPGKKNGASSKP